MQIKSAKFVKGIKGTDEIISDGRFQLAFLGRSNVGKSSTINALLGRKDLVKTSGQPGKTREINWFLINENFYVVDLPGYGYAKAGQKAREKLRKLVLWYLVEAPVERDGRLVVLIIDAKVGLSSHDLDLIHILEEEKQDFIIVANKADKLNQKQTHQMRQKIEQDLSFGVPVLFFSAQTKKGLSSLWKILEEKMS